MGVKRTEATEEGTNTATRVIPLSAEDRADRARKLAKAYGAFEELEADVKAKRKVLNERLKIAKVEISKLARAVNTGQELVDAQTELFDT